MIGEYGSRDAGDGGKGVGLGRPKALPDWSQLSHRCLLRDLMKLLLLIQAKYGEERRNIPLVKFIPWSFSSLISPSCVTQPLGNLREARSLEIAEV